MTSYLWMGEVCELFHWNASCWELDTNEPAFPSISLRTIFRSDLNILDLLRVY